MEEMEGAAELLREALRKKEAEYEEKLLQARQQQTSKLRWSGVLSFGWTESLKLLCGLSNENLSVLVNCSGRSVF